MFFSINTQDNDSRFPINHNHSGFYIGLDAGWKYKHVNSTMIFYKGYCDTDSLENIILEFLTDKTPKFSGNFCIIIVEPKSVTVTHDLSRSFPLFTCQKNTITNLPYNNAEMQRVYSDRYLSLFQDSIIEHYFGWNVTDVDSTVTVDTFLEKTLDILKNKTTNLAHNTNIKMFLTGGVDTMLCYSLLEKFLGDKNFELISYEHIDYDNFLYTNMLDIVSRFWGYRQIHHWKEPTVLVSGAFGDEYFMRGPSTAALWAAWHDVDILNLLETKAPGYHTEYFLRDKNKKIFQQYWNERYSIREQYLSENDLTEQILNMLNNDHQQWHLGNTLTWTPLKEPAITKMILKLPKNDIIDQLLYAKLNFDLISLLNTNLLDYISSSKNKNTFEKIKYFKKQYE